MKNVEKFSDFFIFEKFRQLLTKWAPVEFRATKTRFSGSIWSLQRILWKSHFNAGLFVKNKDSQVPKLHRFLIDFGPRFDLVLDAFSHHVSCFFGIDFGMIFGRHLFTTFSGFYRFLAPKREPEANAYPPLHQKSTLAPPGARSGSFWPPFGDILSIFKDFY